MFSLCGDCEVGQVTIGSAQARKKRRDHLAKRGSFLVGILRAFRDFSCKVRQVTIGSMIFVMASGASIWTPRAVPQNPRAAPQKPRAVTRGAAMGFQTLRARA